MALGLNIIRSVVYSPLTVRMHRVLPLECSIRVDYCAELDNSSLATGTLRPIGLCKIEGYEMKAQHYTVFDKLIYYYI